MGRFFGPGGWIFNSSGGEFKDSGTSSCCFREARKCADNSLSGLTLRVSDIPASNAAKRDADGLCYYWSNSDPILRCAKTDFGSFSSITGCSDSLCGGTPAPCSCAAGGPYNAIYTVAGFGGLSCCNLCDDNATAPCPCTAWDGTLNRVNTTCTWWAANVNFDPLSYANTCRLDITYTQVVLDTTLCQWNLFIACYSQTNPTQVMWAGVKTTGLTPAGTYSFVSSDCGNSTATMTVS